MTITIKDGDNSFLEVTYGVFINKVKAQLTVALTSILGEEICNRFKTGKVVLNELGVCNGITLLIDAKLQEIRDDICILDCDTYSKFLSDIDRELKKED